MSIKQQKQLENYLDNLFKSNHYFMQSLFSSYKMMNLGQIFILNL